MRCCKLKSNVARYQGQLCHDFSCRYFPIIAFPPPSRPLSHNPPQTTQFKTYSRSSTPSTHTRTHSASGAQAYIASAPSALPTRAVARCDARPLRMAAEDTSIQRRLASFVGGYYMCVCLQKCARICLGHLFTV